MIVSSQLFKAYLECSTKCWLRSCAELVADQVIEHVEYLWRDGDDVRPAMQLAPISVKCVLLEEIAQAANPLSGLRSSAL